MMDSFIKEIEKFKLWANLNFPLPQEDLGGEWECDYSEWQNIYNSFAQWQSTYNRGYYINENLLDEFLYIIARDNEMEYIANDLNEILLQILIQRSFENIHCSNNAKWQLATQLHRLSHREIALDYLEQFMKEKDEYVLRRSLLEMANINHPETEYYCIKLWDKEIYGEMEEYQRIAILSALYKINSKKLNYYLDLAKEDGRKYLVLHADKINLRKL